MNTFTVQMELCPEDRARLDKILAALENSEPPLSMVLDTSVVLDTAVKAEEPVEKPAEQKASTKPQATKDDIRKLVVSISAKGKEAKAAAREVVTKYAETITDLPEDKLDEIHKALSALIGGAA